MGQTEKNSVRAYVFRFALELGHCLMQSAFLKREAAIGGSNRQCPDLCGVPSRGHPSAMVATLLAGLPTITAKRHHFVHNLTETTSLIITLSQARYPGTQVATDLTVSILEVNGEGGNETSVDVKLAFGNASFSFDADGFVNWLTGATTATAQISVAGVVAVLGNGEICFGSVTTATVTFTPALLTIAAPAVCAFDVFGIVSAGTSLSLAIPGPAPQTRIVVQASSPFSVPLPSPTPLSPLTARSGFSLQACPRSTTPVRTRFWPAAATTSSSAVSAMTS